MAFSPRSPSPSLFKSTCTLLATDPEEAVMSKSMSPENMIPSLESADVDAKRAKDEAAVTQNEVVLASVDRDEPLVTRKVSSAFPE